MMLIYLSREILKIVQEGWIMLLRDEKTSKVVELYKNILSLYDAWKEKYSLKLNDFQFDN